MKVLKEIELEIECLRKKMHRIIDRGSDLASEEAVKISQNLDKTLTKYHRLKKNHEKNINKDTDADKDKGRGI